MPLVLADRVVERSDTKGLANFTLQGTSTGYQAFSAVGNGSTVYYTIEGVYDDGTLTGEWEVGVGVYNAGILSRDTILSSSTGSKVSFTAGQKNVFIDLPSEKAVVLDDTDKVSGYAITGGSINNTPIGATTPSTGKFTSVTTPSVTAATNDLTLSAISTGVVKLQTAAGEVFRATQGSATGSNYWRTEGAAVTPFLITSGNNGIIATGGTGVLQFVTNTASEQARISHTASAVNYVQVTGASTTGSPSISAQGSDSTINFDIAAKGGGEIRFKPNGATTAVNFAVAFTANTVNYLTATGSGASGNAPRLYPQGSDTNISMAFQPKGTGAINLAAGSSGVNISNGGTVTAITRTNAGSAYTTIPTVAITAPTTAGGVTATASINQMFVSGATISNGGTGYTAGNVLTVSGGTQTGVAQITVSTVSGGVITGITVSSAGAYSVLPTNPVSVTGGSGSGATFNLTWAVISFTITNAGSGYIEQPTVTFSGGGGSGAAAYATVGSATTLRHIGGFHSFTGPSGISFAIISSSGTVANYIQAGSQSTGNFPSLTAVGSDTNVGFDIFTKGNSPFRIRTNASSTEQFRVADTASAVNYVQVTGSSTGNRPIISAQGSDANISWALQSKGTFGLTFLNSSNGIIGSVTHAGSATPNYVQLAATTTTGAPALQAQGGDTNIDLALTPKGTGLVRFGTRTATSDVAITGYLEIKDSAGNIRKLAIID